MGKAAVKAPNLLMGVVPSGIMPENVGDWQALFQTGDHIILPSQTKAARSEPEKDLVQEALVQALSDAREGEELGQPQDKAYKRYKQQIDALTWIYTPGVWCDVRGWSFDWICEVLSLDPDFIRDLLKSEIPRAKLVEDLVLHGKPLPRVPDAIRPGTYGKRRKWREELPC